MLAAGGASAGTDQTWHKKMSVGLGFAWGARETANSESDGAGVKNKTDTTRRERRAGGRDAWL